MDEIENDNDADNETGKAMLTDDLTTDSDNEDTKPPTTASDAAYETRPMIDIRKDEKIENNPTTELSQANQSRQQPPPPSLSQPESETQGHYPSQSDIPRSPPDDDLRTRRRKLEEELTAKKAKKKKRRI